MREATITLKGVRKRYSEDVWAVCGVTLSIYPGELTLLMGPSGSGKTTLISLIGGLLQTTEGRINVCGVDLEQCDETQKQRFRRQYIGFIFQNLNLFSALTARENIQAALALRGADEDLAEELLRRVDMGEKVDAYPSQLSGGQRQRVAVMRALAGDPPVLLADEPTASLDAFQGRRVMALLRDRAHNADTSVLVVTHDPRVRDFADRVIEMEDGYLKRIKRPVRPPSAEPSPPAVSSSARLTPHKSGEDRHAAP